MSGSIFRKNNNMGRSRFSHEQTQFLEYMFETQSRPELCLKRQLANKLGLHPRQVAIWFQNRRARSKSRQTEQDYNNLKENYEMLASKFESLREENKALLTQLQILRDLAKTQQEKGLIRPDLSNKKSNGEFDGDNLDVVSEKYSQNISVFHGGEYSKIVGTEEDGGNFNSDRPSWWEF